MKKIMIIGGEDLSLRIPYMQQLALKGYSIVAVGSQNERAFAASNLFYIRYSLNRWVSPLNDVKTIFQLRRIMKRVQPDIVHGFDTKPALYSLAAALFLPIKVGRTINGTGQIFSEISIKNFLLRCIYWALQTVLSWKSSFTIFQNSYDKAMFESVPTVKNSLNHLILGSGIDCTALPVKENYQSEVKRIIFVSRMLKNKGVYEFLKAARIVKKKYVHSLFFLIGPLSSEGKYAVPLEDIEAYHNDVEYLGARNDVKEIMCESDLMVLPTSYREGVPRVLLEAGAIGLPLLTTNMPGCSDLVDHGKNGWLVSPNDSEELAERMLLFLNTTDDNLRKMGEINKKLIREQYSLEHVVDKCIEIYRSLV
ncbi:glycosyltransferase family 4 protein [Halodesulfovibrio aestuarii]|uniref:Glycosyltransferase involved in cell wall bisynthesis n=1 Tax=Halodesulfovibrio aestuarii TaxID=126333 RepID=A0A8G2CAD3_9BACT|nr:glycosyltransferase family 4 protein [Halodesulfovibrio aestuarii]SHJ29113.1 Glycosyltransferase involved in cell wall bisynthesis [Halodesulfovibrio aestuarii]